MNDLNQNLTNSVVILKEERGVAPSLSGPELRAFRIIAGGGALPSSRTGTIIEGEFLIGKGTCFLTSDKIERLATSQEITDANTVRIARQGHV